MTALPALSIAMSGAVSFSKSALTLTWRSRWPLLLYWSAKMSPSPPYCRV
jgi:hypothetical protein